MDQQDLYALEARCTQEAPPRCRTACPFGLDVRAFLEKLEAGKPAEARKILERHVPLPELMARICDHPCESACVRRDLGGGLAVNALERFCVENAVTGKSLPRPPKTGRVTILGNGLAALVAASELTQKGYGVTIFHEGTPESGVHRRFAGLDGVELGLSSLVEWICVDGEGFPDIAAFTGKFVFVDADACPHAAPARADMDPATLLRDGVCYGGWLEVSPTGHTFASASQQGADGRRAAVTLQRLLEGVSLTAVREEADKPGETRLHVRLEGIDPAPRVVPEHGCFTEEEARREAGRCIRCSCLACVKECVFLQKYRSFPRAYARQIYNNMSIVKGQHLANRVVNSCTLCGQCTEICPERFSMAELCLEARRDMVRRAYMPPSAFEFALQDMAEASGPAAFVLKDQPTGSELAMSVSKGMAEASGPAAFVLKDQPTGSELAMSVSKGMAEASGPPAFVLVDETRPAAKDCLFPGCQLPASRPEQTAALYEQLRPLWQDKGGLSLWQTCCGVPAHWAGNEKLFAEQITTLRTQWEALGRPRLLMACASCLKTFREALPDIPVCGLWAELDAHLPESEMFPPASSLPLFLTMHDPCAARHDPIWQQAVRSLARKRGVKLLEPRLTGTTTACCGYGGGVWNAQPDMADAMSAHRAAELGEIAENGGALASCAMCRDRLAKSMPAWHILDVLVPLSQTGRADAGIPGADQRGIPGLSGRRANRLAFRARLLGESAIQEDNTLRIPPEVLAALERRFILRSDVETAVAGVESAGTFFVELESGHRLGAWRPANVTFWVRYSLDEQGVPTLHDGWCHRMRVPGASQPHENWKVQPRRLDKA